MGAYFQRMVMCSIMFLMGMIFWGRTCSAEGLPFSVKPIMTTEQLTESGNGYFDLILNPEQEKVIHVDIHNETEKMQKIKITSARAHTNKNGLAVYDDQTYHLKNWRKICTIDDSVTIPAAKTVRVPIKINMPQTAFPGLMAGGISFQEEVESDKNSTHSFQIKNEFVCTMAIILRNNMQHDRANMLFKKLVLNTEAKALEVNLQNPMNDFHKNVSVDVWLKRNKHRTYHYKLRGGKFAPSDQFYIRLPMQKKSPPAGNYRATIKVKTNCGTWQFYQNLKISSRIEKSLNKSNQYNIVFYILLMIPIILIVLVIWLVLVIIKLKKNKNKLE